MNRRTRQVQAPRSDARQDPRWAAVVARDPRADGQFVYAVRTTGIYARPSSASKRPNPANVEFFDTATAAEAAGYRCSRRADGDPATIERRHAELVAEACRRMDRAEDAPSLAELARAAGLSPHHFHRVFRAATGLTPKAYASARRARRLREHLARPGRSITDAMYDAGFNASSRFYDDARDVLGMRPRDYRAGGTNAVIRFAVGETSLGPLLVAQSERGVCASG